MALLALTTLLAFITAYTLVAVYRKVMASRRQYHINGTHQRNYLNKLRKRK